VSSAARPVRRRRSPSRQRRRAPSFAAARIVAAIISAAVLGVFLLWFTSDYTVSLQDPLSIHIQSPVVIEKGIDSLDAEQAHADHRRRLTAWQQYACRKFGSDCRVARRKSCRVARRKSAASLRGVPTIAASTASSSRLRERRAFVRCSPAFNGRT
jgi:hypothetical protein